MAPQLYPISLLDSDQVIQYVYDETTQSLRTTATAIIIGGDVTVDIDGIYSGTNLVPDNIGLIGHVRGASPGYPDQTVRLTSIVSGNSRSLDVSIHNSDGTAVTNLTPLPVSGTITTSPDVNIRDGLANLLTSQVNGAQRALDVGINVAGIQIDPRSIRALTAADIVTAEQGTSPWVVSGTVATTQSGIWSVGRTWVLASGTDSVDSVQSGTWNINNITGTVSLPTGASTSALQTTGNTSLSSIDGKIPAGLTVASTRLLVDGSGVTQPVSAVTLPLPTGASTSANQLSLIGSASGGTAATNSELVGGVFNTVLPALTNGQQSSLQLDSSGRLITTTSATLSNDTNYGVVGGSTLRTASQIGNATGAALFGAGTTTGQVLRVVLPTDQTAIPATQSGSWTVNQGGAALPSDAWYMRITDGSTTVGVTAFSLNTVNTNAAGAAAVNIQDGGNSITIDATSLPLPTGAATAALQTQPGVDIGDVTVNNASGAAAVNIQDGGNSITIDAVSLPLPTGAATSALQTTGNTSLSSIDGKIPAGLTVTSTRLLVDGSGVTQPISAASLPLPTGASTSANQTTANASLASIDAGIPAALGQTTMANSMPVVISSDQSPISVTGTFTPGASNIATYSAQITALATAASATDIFTITGSGSTTVKIKKIRTTATRTTSSNTEILLIKRSTANSGGTSSTPAIGAHDSNNPAATAVVRAYTANPTLGTSVATIRCQKQFINTVGAGTTDVINWEFGDNSSQPVVLRGTSQVLSVNLNSTTISSPSFDIYIEWTEE